MPIYWAKLNSCHQCTATSKIPLLVYRNDDVGANQAIKDFSFISFARIRMDYDSTDAANFPYLEADASTDADYLTRGAF